MLGKDGGTVARSLVIVFVDGAKVRWAQTEDTGQMSRNDFGGCLSRLLSKHDNNGTRIGQIRLVKNGFRKNPS
jgi:hypothetical protein